MSGIKHAIKRLRRGKKIGLLVDGKNLGDSKMDVELSNIKTVIGEIGNLRLAKVLLDELPSDDVSKAISKLGFLSIVHLNDLDIYMALEAMELAYNDKIKVLALATEDENLIPVLAKAKERGKETVIVEIVEGTIGEGLKNSADYFCQFPKENPRE
ncbi:MAG: NYN domain-containing protein [Candidatus Hodarchaeota archaeon]